MSEKGPNQQLVLHLEGFEGPLELLLELARTQKIDLAAISILALVEQYLVVIEGAREVSLELAADWLVMAAWLAWLKSRLLLPEGSPEAEEGERAAESLAGRLAALEAMQKAAAWLAARPLLGRDVFPRGQPENFTKVDRSRLRLDLPALVSAYLSTLRRARAGVRYRAAPLTLWTVQNALERLQRLLGNLPDWSSLERFLPEHLAEPTERRAALASTLLASLELARDGTLRVRQEHPFGPILLASRTAGAVRPE